VIVLDNMPPFSARSFSLLLAYPYWVSQRGAPGFDAWVEKYIRPILGINYGQVVARIRNGRWPFAFERKKYGLPRSSTEYHVKLEDIIASGLLLPELTQAARPILEQLHGELIAAEAKVHHVEQTAAIFEF